MLDGEDSSPGQLGNIREHCGPVEFFSGAIAITKRVIKANGIELGVCFLNEPLDIVLVVPTMIIAPIGKDEQGTFGVMCTPHLTEPEVDSVQKGSPALRGSQHHPALKIFDTVGKRAGEFSALIEADQKKLILRIGGLEELQRGFACFVNLIAHAAAEIENDTDGDGYVFGGKSDDFLLGAVFVNAEVILIQTSHKAVEGVGDGDVHKSEVDVAADDLAWNDFDGRSIAFRVQKLRSGRQGSGWEGVILGFLGKQWEGEAQQHGTSEEAGQRKQRKPGTGHYL